MTSTTRRRTPEWIVFEGRFYRLSNEPGSPPWTHVDRASDWAPHFDSTEGEVTPIRRSVLDVEVARLRKLFGRSNL